MTKEEKAHFEELKKRTGRGLKNCLICDKSDTCKKNKHSGTRNCKLFVPNEDKERELLEKRHKFKSSLSKVLRFPLDLVEMSPYVEEYLDGYRKLFERD